MRVSKKIILTILSLSLFVFSVSCSNEKTTGGGGGVPPAAPEVPDGGGGEANPDTPFEAVEESGNQKDITIKSADGSSVNETTGKIEFTVTGASDYTAKISSVTKIGSSPVDFDVSDFEYNKANGELKLSSAGLIKFENSKDQFSESGDKYTITFEVADSSDQNRKKDVNVQISLIKAKADTPPESSRRKW